MSDSSTVVITGAGSGLGRALALRYAREGWAVAVLDLSVDTAEATAQAVREAGGRAMAAAADVRDEDSLAAAAERAAAELGPIGAWVNNAGIASAGTVEDAPIAQWQGVLDINLLGVVRGARVAIPHLRAAGGGHIANVASFAGIANPPAMASYNVAKAGVISLSETLRAELADDGIHVLVACPSFFQTNLVQSSRSVAGDSDMTDAAPQMSVITQRLMERSAFTAEDVADAILGAADAGRFLVIMPPDRTRWLAKRASPELFFRMVLKSTRSFLRKPAPH